MTCLGCDSPHHSYATCPHYVPRVEKETSMTVKTRPTFTAASALALHRQAHEAGMAAGEAVMPMPMLVVERERPFDETSRIVRQYAPVEGGVCGFAYIRFPATTGFARAMKKAGIAHSSSYHGGVFVSARAFGQSLARKEAYARAYAGVLVEAGIEKVYVDARID